MIDPSNPTVRQKKLSSIIKDSVNSCFRNIELSIEGSQVLCSRAVLSKDLRNCDIFITSNIELLDNFQASINSESVEIGSNVIDAVKLEIQNNVDLRYMPNFRFYLFN